MSTVVVPGSDRSNAFMVVTHVFPSAATGQNGAGPQPTATALPVSAVPNTAPEYTGDTGVILNRETAAPEQFVKFLKVHPKAMGTVQIMIGIIHLLFAIVLSVSASRAIASGVVFWGPVIYISAGSLSVSAEKKLNSCLVKASLIMNVFSAITAAVAILLLSLDFLVQTGYDPCYYPYNNYEACQAYLQFLSRTQGISGVLLVFSLLQFIISICVSAFGCKATCCNDPMVSVVTVAPTPAACCSLTNPFYAPSRPQDVFYIANPNVNVNNTPTQNPPAYVPNSQKPDE
ncbi:membrane-spanning 4-domains subfamily A member 15 isoform X3 [Astyanax mexicanus]|uniref:membrane-spanning 4-domains subfamily A member 15 isoform X3 n=1 Tax=Astyanax mexicanus TaxID=7994 RepID=UPI0020CB1B0C|nr:membrane-spanning 4-domains subfamily A member 15 isoform X3 [Astyanax mexicanus]